MRDLLFLGVSTTHSTVHHVFDQWAACLGLNAKLRCVDLPLGSPQASYIELLRQIRDSDVIAGALITSHKTRMFEAGEGILEQCRPAASLLKEVGAIWRSSKGGLIGDATDPPAVTYAVRELSKITGSLPKCVCVLGMGGSGLSLAYALLSSNERPFRLMLTDVSEGRLSAVAAILKPFSDGVQIDYVVAGHDVNSRVESLPEGAWIVNATGLGKDAPGSPLAPDCVLPRHALMWDFNYRGERQFLVDAQQQRAARGLLLADGWHYFVAGWHDVMCHIFHVTAAKENFAAFLSIANKIRADQPFDLVA